MLLVRLLLEIQFLGVKRCMQIFDSEGEGEGWYPYPDIVQGSIIILFLLVLRVQSSLGFKRSASNLISPMNPVIFSAQFYKTQFSSGVHVSHSGKKACQPHLLLTCQYTWP